MRGALNWLTVVVPCVLIAAGCTTLTTRVDNAPGRPTTYGDPTTPGTVTGIGVESQDIVSMTDTMVRDLLSNPTLAGRPTPPRVIMDAEYFRNEGASRLNKNSIVDRLRIELNRAANGRLIFIGRHYTDMVEAERTLKRAGVVDAGTTRQVQAAAGGDYRFGGRITTLDAVAAKSGITSRYHQITFEMVDLETGTIVWSGIYEFRKTAQDDIIYR